MDSSLAHANFGSLHTTVEDAVYSKKPTSLDQLRNEIVNAFRQISPEFCKKVCRALETCLHKYIQGGGWHFEQDF
jgi:hypothetical protein